MLCSIRDVVGLDVDKEVVGQDQPSLADHAICDVHVGCPWSRALSMLSCVAAHADARERAMKC
jgi:hypothetical protein